MTRISPSAPAVNSTVAEIKSRFTLRDVAANLGLELPTRDGAKFRSPLRHDRNPSCTIKGNVLFDWSTGEHFDAIDLYAAAKQISNAEAIRELAERLNIAGRTPERPNAQPARASKPPTPEKPAAPVSFDESQPTDDDFAAILQTRKLPPEALSGLLVAYDVGVLRFATIGDFRCWLVSYTRRICAEARRLDGKPFPAVGSLAARKAHTLKGSTKSWPVGLLPGAKAERLRALPLVLVEGSPDLLAAYALLGVLPMDTMDVQPVAMLGTSSSISPEALQLMAGRRAVILAHGDQAGSGAARRWAGQLVGAGCRVKVRDLPDGQDLNDAVAAHGLDAMKGAIQP
jgi:hypothetical protein